MKKYIVSFVVVLAVAGYLVYRSVSATSTQLDIVVNPPVSSTPTPSSSPSSTSSSPQSYTGDAVDVGYGTVQVKITMADGKLTDIQYLQYPNSPGHTSEVSARALPILRSEAIQAQSAHVAIVSGATQTSGGFQQSLASALAMVP